MKRHILIALASLCFCFTAKADHITGGEMFYTYAGMVGGMLQYDVTLKFYMRCNSGRQFNNPNIVSIFDRATNQRVAGVSVALADQRTISITDHNPCITN